MNRYGRSTIGGPSKANANTLCQKCLKRDKSTVIQNLHPKLTIKPRHYSYECKAVVQERPYVSRPSRTQQLLNPKLMPKLTTEVPQDLLRKKGIADEQLAKKEEERGRQREKEDAEDAELRAAAKSKRSRSRSISSSISVSTISTNASRSRSKDRQAAPSTEPQRKRKRHRRSLSSGASNLSDTNEDYHRRSRRTRSPQGELDGRSSDRPRRRSRSHSYGRRSPSLDERSRAKGTNDRKRELTPVVDTNYGGPSDAPSRSRKSRSPDRSGNGYSAAERGPPRDGHRNARGDYRSRRDYDNYNSRRISFPTDTKGPVASQQGTIPEGPPRKRSLSPFSRRVALTKSLNMGR